MAQKGGGAPGILVSPRSKSVIPRNFQQVVPLGQKSVSIQKVINSQIHALSANSSKLGVLHNKFDSGKFEKDQYQKV